MGEQKYEWQMVGEMEDDASAGVMLKHEAMYGEAERVLRGERVAWILGNEVLTFDDEMRVVVMSVADEGGSAVLPEEVQGAILDGLLCVAGTRSVMAEFVVSIGRLEGNPWDAPDAGAVITVIGKDAVLWGHCRMPVHAGYPVPRPIDSPYPPFVRLSRDNAASEERRRRHSAMRMEGFDVMNGLGPKPWAAPSVFNPSEMVVLVISRTSRVALGSLPCGAIEAMHRDCVRVFCRRDELFGFTGGMGGLTQVICDFNPGLPLLVTIHEGEVMFWPVRTLAVTSPGGDA